MTDERIEILRKVPLFDGLSDKELAAVTKAAKERRFDTGDTIVSEGEGGVGFFVIAEGTARVEMHRRAARNVGPRQLVRRGGAAREGGRRTASVIAEAPVRVFGLTAWQFTPLLEQHPAIAVKIARRSWPAGCAQTQERAATEAEAASMARDRAKRGASGTLYRQSALAGPNSHPRGGGFGIGSVRSVSIARSHATEACEPRQVRKEAALSNVSRVPRASLAGACVTSTVRAHRPERWVHGHY